MTVERAKWVEIAPFVALAAKERVNVTNVKNCVWFKTVNGKGRITGFAGVAPVGDRKARIRAVWVRPDFRGLGLGDEVSLACLNYALGAKFDEVEILSWDKRWALRSGFEERGENQHGASRLIYSRKQAD